MGMIYYIVMREGKPRLQMIFGTAGSARSAGRAALYDFDECEVVKVELKRI